MKQLVSSLLFGSMMFFVSCGDNSGNEASESTEDTTQSMAADSSANNVMTKTINLSGDQEVPANNSSAKGTADVSYDKGSKTLTFTINYDGLTEKATMAHIHGTAAKGANAGVVHDLTGKLQKETKGSFSDTVRIEGNIKEDSLLQGFYYFNIHTSKHPGGEIRGQIEF